DVAQHPVEIMKALLAVRRNDDHLARAVLGRDVIDPKSDLLTGLADKGLVRISQVSRGKAIDGNDVFSGLHVDPDLCQRTPVLGIPVVAGQDSVDSNIPAFMATEFCAEQPQRNALRLWIVAAP